jgi:hypothetical protein
MFVSSYQIQEHHTPENHFPNPQSCGDLKSYRIIPTFKLLRFSFNMRRKEKCTGHRTAWSRAFCEKLTIADIGSFLPLIEKSV